MFLIIPKYFNGGRFPSFGGSREAFGNFDAGLNPQSRRSKGLDLDVPAGNSIIYVLYLITFHLSGLNASEDQHS